MARIDAAIANMRGQMGRGGTAQGPPVHLGGRYGGGGGGGGAISPGYRYNIDPGFSSGQGNAPPDLSRFLPPGGGPPPVPGSHNIDAGVIDFLNRGGGDVMPGNPWDNPNLQPLPDVHRAPGVPGGVISRDGQQGIIGRGGHFQPLGEHALANQPPPMIGVTQPARLPTGVSPNDWPSIMGDYPGVDPREAAGTLDPTIGRALPGGLPGSADYAHATPLEQQRMMESLNGIKPVMTAFGPETTLPPGAVPRGGAGFGGGIPPNYEAALLRAQGALHPSHPLHPMNNPHRLAQALAIRGRGNFNPMQFYAQNANPVYAPPTVRGIR